MIIGTWVDTGPLNVAILEFELLDQWKLLGVPYTRYTNEEAAHTIRAILTGIARQGGRFVRWRDHLAGGGGETLSLDHEALVQYVIASGATQPRELNDDDLLTYTRADVEKVLRCIGCQDVALVR